MTTKNNMTDLLSTMARLRDPDTGCPWDVEQTYDSLTKHTLEETYEVIDAIDRKNMPDLKDELGDLLLQVIFYAQIAAEDGHFDFNDVAEGLNNKLIRRHPHVFGDKTAQNASDVNKIWAEVKNTEKQQKQAKNDGKTEFKSILGDIPLALPALQRLYEIDKSSAKVGFDWDDINGVFAKIDEEIAEIKEAIDENHSKEALELEIGDLLGAVAVLARWVDVNPERALQKGCHKYVTRFHYIEEQAFKAGKSVEECGVEQMITWWEDAKKQAKTAV